jgi:parvulin-like peptidyl-prolyl isomerase
MIVGGGGLLIVLIRFSQRRDDPPPVVAARLKRQLGLSNEQTAEVQEIVRTRQEALRKIRNDAQPRFQAEIDLLEKQIADVLSNDRQKAKWRAGVASSLRRTWFAATQVKDSPKTSVSSP